MKVLIADDEPNICELIRCEIQWDLLGLDLCATAYNGMEVLDAIDMHRPDIVITDIQMPGLSGLDMIEQIQNRKLYPKFIIISGYSYFEYARQAVKFGVEDFLLKPINQKELNDALRMVIEKIQDDRKQTQTALKTQDEINHSHTKIRKAFLLRGEVPQQNLLTVLQMNEEYHFHFQCPYYLIGVLHAGYADLQLQASLILGSAEKVLERYLEPLCSDFETAVDAKNRLYFIINFDREPDVVMRALQYSLKDMCNDDFMPGKISLAIGISGVFSDLYEYSGAYRRAQAAVESRFVLGTNRVLLPPNTSDEKETVPMPKFAKQLREYMDSMQLEKVESLVCDTVETLLVSLKSHPHLALKQMRMLILEFSLCTKQSHGQEELFTMFEQLGSGQELVAAIERYVSQVTAEIRNVMESQNRKVIEIAKEYILAHYDSPLDLAQVAQQVYLAPTYFGVLFKSETGVNFSEYLTDTRIHASKKLLKDLRYNVSQAASLVGYKDVKYFSRLFKKEVGINPTDYQNPH